MASLFRNALHQDFGTWPLGYIPYGGADFGEVRAVAEAIGDGDDAAYYDAWNAAADRLKAEADAKGHAASARALYLRASAFYATVIVRMFGITAEAAKDLGALDESLIERLDTYIRGDRQLRWKVIQRGFWVHGVDDLRSYLASAELFTMQGHAERIRCPTLITMAEHDALSAAAGAFFEALHCPKTLLHFTASEGADGHCEMQNRSLLNQRVIDWIDEQFGSLG
jgi:hypothetical protein